MWRQLLRNRKREILARWRDQILETYPADTSRFLKEERDRFNNPVGYVISHSIDAIFEGLLQDRAPEDLAQALDDMVRIRSVQDFSPSRAVLFVFQLKQAIRQELNSAIHGDKIAEDWLTFESRIDTLALLAFDLYAACREKIHEIRIKEIKGRSPVWFERRTAGRSRHGSTEEQ